MKRFFLALTVLMGSFGVFASDPGGDPGFVKAVFNSYCDTSSSITANAIGRTIYPEELYTSFTRERVTFAWSGYMYMTGGVTYNFRGRCDDYSYLKVNGSVRFSGTGSYSGYTFTPSTTDWYPIELRLANNGGTGGGYNSTYFGIQWQVSGESTWRNFIDPGDGSLFKTGRTGLKDLLKRDVPTVLSTQMRKTDPSIMDIEYRVASTKSKVNTRAVAFDCSTTTDRSFWTIQLPKNFVKDTSGRETAGNVGDNVPANTTLKLAWKVPEDWDIDIAKVRFEILTSDSAQLPMKNISIPATAKNPAMTVAYNEQTDADIFNAIMWWYACGDTNLVNDNGYVSNAKGERWVDRTSISGDRMSSLKWLYAKIGYEPLIGNLMDYARKSTRKDLWWNSSTRTAAIKTSTKPMNLYLGEKAYCVIDLSGGSSASKYPVSYLNSEPTAGWSDDYKKTKLILRRVPAGKFNLHGEKPVTLTKDCYVGVFPVTQYQYKQVMGSLPSQSNTGDKRPVEISWNAARGSSSTYNWPTRTDVDPTTFIGKLQAKTGLSIDLPTEAQWEYACRAGTTTLYYNGGNQDTSYDTESNSSCAYNGQFIYSYNVSQGYNCVKDINAIAFWQFDSTMTADVGQYMSNFWGFYDMLGNIGEWTLNWYEVGDRDPAIDYPGPQSGNFRLFKGYFNKYYYNVYITSNGRFGASPSQSYGYGSSYSRIGIRLCATVTE